MFNKKKIKALEARLDKLEQDNTNIHNKLEHVFRWIREHEDIYEIAAETEREFLELTK